MIKKAVIVSGGDWDEVTDLYLKENNYVIACDRAALTLIRKGITPDLSVGDFDSVSQDDLSLIKRISKKTVVHPRQKDMTDLDLAIKEALRQKAVKLVILGSIGSRLDHSLFSVFALEKASRFSSVSLENSKNRIIYLGKDRCYKLMPEKRLSYFSVISLEGKTVVSIEKAKYSVKKESLLRTESRFISNEFLGKPVKITVHKGKILIIQSRD